MARLNNLKEEVIDREASQGKWMEVINFKIVIKL
jgi:hypothetical protein